MRPRSLIEQPSVIMVGPFPPPAFGMAIGNAVVRERLEAMGAKLIVINLAPPNLDRRLRYRLYRVPTVLGGLLRLLMARRVRGCALYMRISGGLGQFYETCFLMIGRMRGVRPFVSHHSYAYLDKRHLLTTILVAVSGKRATQIALSETMAAKLEDLYPGVGHAFAISNAAVFLDESSVCARERTTIWTIGFLSNVSEDKGVFRFLDVVAELESRGFAVQAKLAGPFQDHKTEGRVRGRLEQLKAVKYVGAKYGSEKWAFLDKIDVLLFPTIYKYEAEPRTVHEALMCGIPVIANRRGCIGEVLKEGAGLVVDRPEDFVWKAVKQIETWLASPDQFQKASRVARERYLTLRNESAGRLESLLREIYNSDPTN